MLGTLGCSYTADLRQLLDSVRSWTATARFALDRLDAGAVTPTYAAEIRDAARTALAEVPRQLGDRRVAPDTARQLRAATDSLAAAVRELDAALAAPASAPSRRLR